jgi:hypothetical protein
MGVSTNGRKISRDDLQAAYSQVLGEGQSTAERAMPQVALVGGAIALAVIALAYLAGRRRGQKRSAVVEVRRI